MAENGANVIEIRKALQLKFSSKALRPVLRMDPDIYDSLDANPSAMVVLRSNEQSLSLNDALPVRAISSKLTIQLQHTSLRDVLSSTWDYMADLRAAIDTELEPFDVLLTLPGDTVLDERIRKARLTERGSVNGITFQVDVAVTALGWNTATDMLVSVKHLFSVSDLDYAWQAGQPSGGGRGREWL